MCFKLFVPIVNRSIHVLLVELMLTFVETETLLYADICIVVLWKSLIVRSKFSRLQWWFHNRN